MSAFISEQKQEWWKQIILFHNTEGLFWRVSQKGALKYLEFIQWSYCVKTAPIRICKMPYKGSIPFHTPWKSHLFSDILAGASILSSITVSSWYQLSWTGCLEYMVLAQNLDLLSPTHCMSGEHHSFGKSTDYFPAGHSLQYLCSAIM